MGAKKLRTWKPAPQPVSADWHERKELLNIFQLMTITQEGYQSLLDDTKAGRVRAVESRPFRYTPTEILRVYFPDQSRPQSQPLKVEQTVSKVKRRITQRRKGDLWR